MRKSLDTMLLLVLVLVASPVAAQAMEHRWSRKRDLRTLAAKRPNSTIRNSGMDRRIHDSGELRTFFRAEPAATA